MLRASGTLTRTDLPAELSLTVDGIKYHLAKLKAAGRIQYVGPARGGYWKVLTNLNKQRGELSDA